MPEVHGCGHQVCRYIRQNHISTYSNIKPVHENSSINNEKRPLLNSD